MVPFPEIVQSRFVYCGEAGSIRRIVESGCGDAVL
jgi:hypothetical protein